MEMLPRFLSLNQMVYGGKILMKRKGPPGSGPSPSARGQREWEGLKCNHILSSCTLRVQLGYFPFSHGMIPEKCSSLTLWAWVNPQMFEGYVELTKNVLVRGWSRGMLSSYLEADIRRVRYSEWIMTNPRTIPIRSARESCHAHCRPGMRT